MGKWLMSVGISQARVIAVALGTTAIQGGGVEGSQRGAGLQAFNQIRVADKGAAKGKQIGFALAQAGAGQVEVITVVGQVGVLEAAAQCMEIERRNIAWAAGGTFHHMQINDA